MQPLPRSFYDRHTALVGRELLGKWLVRPADGLLRIGKIVETEVDLSEHDLAAHTAPGPDGPHGDHVRSAGPCLRLLRLWHAFRLNVVTEPVGHGSAVLLGGRSNRWPTSPNALAGQACCAGRCRLTNNSTAKICWATTCSSPSRKRRSVQHRQRPADRGGLCAPLGATPFALLYQEQPLRLAGLT